MRAVAKFLISAAAAALAVQSTPQPAFAETEACNIVSTRVNTASAVQTTTSQTFVDVPGAAVEFNTEQPGTCAIVEVTAQLQAADPRLARVRVVLDDSEFDIAPKLASMYTSQSRFDQRTVRFVLRNFAPGLHTLQVQFLSTNGAPVSLSKVVTTVHYNNL